MATSRARTAAKRQAAGVDLDSAAFIRALQQAVKGMRVTAEQQLLKVGLTMQNEARRLSPVDTGTLRAGWVMTQGSDARGIYVKVSNRVNYAPHVEYGTITSPAQPMIRPAALLALRAFGVS